jgi:hypothetical protein
MTGGMAKWEMSIFHMRDIEKKNYVASWLQLKYPMILNFYMKTAVDNNCLRNVQKV